MNKNYEKINNFSEFVKKIWGTQSEYCRMRCDCLNYLNFVLNPQIKDVKEELQRCVDESFGDPRSKQYEYLFKKYELLCAIREHLRHEEYPSALKAIDDLNEMKEENALVD